MSYPPNVQSAIYLVEEIPPEQQRIIFNKKQIEDENDLASYKICPGAELYLNLRLRGGMFHDTSGRDGNYRSIKNLYFSLDNRDIVKHYIPDKPILKHSSHKWDTIKNPYQYYGVGQVQCKYDDLDL